VDAADAALARSWPPAPASARWSETRRLAALVLVMAPDLHICSSFLAGFTGLLPGRSGK